MFLFQMYLFARFLWPFVALTVVGVVLWTLFMRFRLKRPVGRAEDVVFSRKWLVIIAMMVLVTFAPAVFAGVIEKGLAPADDCGMAES